MENLTNTEESKKVNCLSKQMPNIETTFHIGDNIIEFQQRKLTVGEVKSYQTVRRSIHGDKDIFKALMEEREATEIFEKKAEELRTKIEQTAKQIDALEEKSHKRTVLQEKLNGFHKEIRDLKPEFSPETAYRIKVATAKINDAAFDVDRQFVINSCSASKFYGGFCKVNGEIISDKGELKELLSELSEEQFNELLLNARSLQFPSQEDIDEGKHSQTVKE